MTLEQQTAQAMAAAGWKIIPIPPGYKYPKGIDQWQQKTAADATPWDTRPDWGIGWVLGPQPNGRNIAAIDVDTHDNKPGPKHFLEFVKRHGIDNAIQNTCTARTGGNGFHFVFDTDTTVVGNGVFHPDIGEYKGDNGFIVVAPTIHPTTGNRYAWVPGKSPLELDPHPMPAAILDQIQAPDRVGTIQRRAINTDRPTITTPRSEFDPADWVRTNLGYTRLLEDLGWTDAGRGQWTRPGKTVRDGTSATLHEPDGPFVVFSTTGQGMLGPVGTPGDTGTISYSPLDLYAALNHNSNLSDAAKHIRAQHAPTPTHRTVNPATGEIVEISEGDRWCNLPDEFWNARPWLTHVRQAAHSRLLSADLVYAATLARIIALIPPAYRIPPIVGAPASLDYLGVVTADSGGGKSAAMSVARELVPIDHKTIKADRKVSTGEGMTESFMGYVTVTNDEGKEVQERAVVNTALHFTVDEGRTLIAQQKRDTATIASELCSAWSGAPLGQENAAQDRRRYIPPMSVRVAGIVAIQTSFAWELLTDELVQQGFAGRLQFYWGVDNLIDPDTDWPDRLPLPTWPTYGQDATWIRPNQTIKDRLRADMLARQKGELVVAGIDAHRNLVVLKNAAVFALMDDRHEINDDDWHLAELAHQYSTRIRTLALEQRALQKRQQIEEKAAAATAYEFELTASTDQRRHEAVADILSKIEPALAAAGNEGATVKDLRQHISSRVRHLIPTALEQSDACVKHGRRWYHTNHTPE